MAIHTKNVPPGHQWVQTEDGSSTLFSEAYQEACHSTTGAAAETLLHYVQGCQVVDKLKQNNELSILEVGFGLGIGFHVTYDKLKDVRGKWSFLSLEIDEKLLEWFRQENLDHPFLKYLQWVDINGIKILKAQDQDISLTILCGDARKTLPAYLELHPQKWQAIYQDAFSPKRNPVLWTKEWFELLRTHSASDVLLSTYSASTSIRKSLIEAGWTLQKGEKFGPKRTSTRASLSGVSDPDILLHLSRSPASALRDDNLEEFLSKSKA